MGGKRRFDDLNAMRNGMSLCAPGDKCFKNPEYCKDFFKEGGLVPGSSNRLSHTRNISKQSNNFYQTLDIKKGSLNADKLWVNKVKKEYSDFDENYVKTLTVWEKNVLGDLAKPAEIIPPPKGKGGNDKKITASPVKSPVKKK